jgi:hypothetical protein
MAVSDASLVEAAPLRSSEVTSIALPIARESAIKWLTLGAIALIDAVWIAASDFHLVFAGAAGPVICALLFAAAAYFFRVVRRNPTFFTLTDTLAQLIVCFAVCGVLSYLVISTNEPLADSQLAALDRALGFDWPRFIRWVQARPAADYTLWLAYRSSIVQMFMIVSLLSHWREARVGELSGTIIISLILTVLISGALPCASAYPFYGPTHPEIVPEIGVHDLFALRDGSLRDLDLTAMDGLITFPSFHVILSLLFMYVLRGVPILFPLGVVANIAVIVSTLTAGGHYLVDWFGALIVTMISIALYRLVQGRKTTSAAARPFTIVASTAQRAAP